MHWRRPGHRAGPRKLELTNSASFPASSISSHHCGKHRRLQWRTKQIQRVILRYRRSSTGSSRTRRQRKKLAVALAVNLPERGGLGSRARLVSIFGIRAGRLGAPSTRAGITETAARRGWSGTRRASCKRRAAWPKPHVCKGLKSVSCGRLFRAGDPDPCCRQISEVEEPDFAWEKRPEHGDGGS